MRGRDEEREKRGRRGDLDLPKDGVVEVAVVVRVGLAGMVCFVAQRGAVGLELVKGRGHVQAGPVVQGDVVRILCPVLLVRLLQAQPLPVVERTHEPGRKVLVE